MNHTKFRFLVIFWFCTGLLGHACSSQGTPSPANFRTPIPLAATTIPTAAPLVVTGVQPAFNCENDARFLEDLTIPDYSIVVPAEILDKRWAVQNSGSCDWNQDYRLVRLGQDAFEGPRFLALYPARAGTSAVWQVRLLAPEEPGSYVSQWQAQSPNGTLFGEVVYILVNVELPTATPSPTPLISPTPQ